MSLSALLEIQGMEKTPHTAEWDHLPRHDDPLPNYPDWAYWYNALWHYWATRKDGEVFGVAARLRNYAYPATISSPKRPNVVVVTIDQEGWRWNPPLALEETPSNEAALSAADQFRSNLCSKIVRHLL